MDPLRRSEEPSKPTLVHPSLRVPIADDRGRRSSRRQARDSSKEGSERPAVVLDLSTTPAHAAAPPTPLTTGARRIDLRV